MAVFHPTPAPTDEDVARVVVAVFRRVERTLADREPDAAQRRFIESAPVLPGSPRRRPGASSRPARAGAAGSSAFEAHQQTSTLS